jgi:hypothetical protein
MTFPSAKFTPVECAHAYKNDSHLGQSLAFRASTRAPYVAQTKTLTQPKATFLSRFRTRQQLKRLHEVILTRTLQPSKISIVKVRMEKKMLFMLSTVTRRTAKKVARWQ